MESKIKIDDIKEAVRNGNVNVRYHARRRMAERDIYYEDIVKVITEGKIIEEYPDAYPFPACLVLGFVRNSPLYVVCSFDGETAYIITVHWLEPKKWLDPWTRRHK